MLYLGLILFTIGVWQSSANGRLSPVIGNISLPLGAIFIIIGNWVVGLFIVFMYISWLLLMQIFRFSTYHAYFWWSSLFLIGYALLVSFLIRKFNFQDYFLWYLLLSVVYLLINHKKQHETKSLFTPFQENKQEKEVLEKSVSRTIKYHALSSLIFILFVILGFYIL